MREFDLFSEQMEKFNGLLAENGLVGKFKPTQYPIEVEVVKDELTRGQVGMFDNDEEETYKNTRIVISFPIGVTTVEFLGKITIAEKTLNKIKTQAKKLHDLYLQGFFASEKVKYENDVKSEV